MRVGVFNKVEAIATEAHSSVASNGSTTYGKEMDHKVSATDAKVSSTHSKDEGKNNLNG